MDVSGLFDLSGSSAIVTGSTRGIGRAIAEAMAHHGAKVVISSRKQDECDEVAEAIRAAGGQARGIACDVSDPAQQQALVAHAKEEFGPTTVLVANAAHNPHIGSMLDISREQFDKTLAVNLVSVHQLCQLVLPDMREAGLGSIVLISSFGSLRGNTILGAYAISKAALNQLTRNIAVEFGSEGIRANTIAPGLVKTEFAGPLWQNPELAKAQIEKTPLGRIGEPEDIAGAAVFLASQASGWMTGQTLVIDGGVTVVNR
jgi:NAD(P)-dependent dehydrogenase (short-subunit alcohol dehydrogenase family)